MVSGHQWCCVCQQSMVSGHQRCCVHQYKKDTDMNSVIWLSVSVITTKTQTSADSGMWLLLHHSPHTHLSLSQCHIWPTLGMLCCPTNINKQRRTSQLLELWLSTVQIYTYYMTLFCTHTDNLFLLFSVCKMSFIPKKMDFFGFIAVQK